MKLILILLLSLMLMGCQSNNRLPDGKKAACIGLNDDPDPQYVYKYSVRNIAVGIIFFELIVPPIDVVFNELRCPVGYSNQIKRGEK